MYYFKYLRGFKAGSIQSWGGVQAVIGAGSVDLKAGRHPVEKLLPPFTGLGGKKENFRPGTALKEEVFFYPEGIATPALLTFARGERVKVIRLDLLTARPVVGASRAE